MATEEDERTGGAIERSTDSAHILTPDGTEVTGRARVAEVLRQITSSDHQLEIRVGRTVVTGSIALSLLSSSETGAPAPVSGLCGHPCRRRQCSR